MWVPEHRSGESDPRRQRAAKDPELQKGGHLRDSRRQRAAKDPELQKGRHLRVGPVIPGLLPWLPSQPHQELKARILIPTLQRGHRASQGMLVVKSPPAMQETY